MADEPHFDYPFRMGSNGHAVENEQDDDNDVIARVQAVLRTPLGFREDLPDFGVAEVLFREKIDAEEVRQALEQWVPEADFLINVTDDEIDKFLKTIHVGVKARGND